MILRNIFAIVLLSSFYGTIVGLIILLLKNTLLKQLKPKYHFWLWWIMIIKLILPKGPQSKISIFNNVNLNYTENIENAIQVTNTHIDASSMFPQFDVFAFVAYLWVIVTIASLIIILLNRIILGIKIKKDRKQNQEDLICILKECKSLLCIKNEFDIIIQNHIPYPSLLGIFNPKIILTNNTVKKDTKNLKYIFLHELAHYKRCDNLTNLMLLIIQCVHWFNPIIWFIFNNYIHKDVELATDELVLDYLEDCECQSYGNALIRNIETQNGTLLYGLLGLNRNKKDIALRLHTISNYKKSSFLQKVSGTAYFVLLSAVLLTSSVSLKSISNATLQPLPKGYYEFQRLNNPNENIIKKQSKELISVKEEAKHTTVNPSASIEYNTDFLEKNSVIIKTGSEGCFIFYFKNNSTEHPIKFNISKPENDGLGWDFVTNANNNGIFYYGGLESNAEYIIKIDSYCPGKYGINGKIIIKGE